MRFANRPDVYKRIHLRPMAAGVKAMQTTINIDGKVVNVHTTREADAILAHRDLPLTVEMELYFSCLLCKKVRFVYQPGNLSEGVAINDKLAVRFRTVTNQVCRPDEYDSTVLVEFPIVRRQPYVPSWLVIDFRFGHWYGEFGYLDQQQAA